MRRVFLIDALLCTACGRQRRVIAAIEEGTVAREILEHLGWPTGVPRASQGQLFPTGPPHHEEMEADALADPWSMETLDHRLPDSDSFADSLA